MPDRQHCGDRHGVRRSALRVDGLVSAPALTVQRQGLGSVNADQLNTYGQTCDTFADLRGFIGIQGIQVYTRGGNSINDGLQGEFYWDAASVASDNNFSVIVPSGALQ